MITKNFKKIKTQVIRACQRVGRQEKEVLLLAATKDRSVTAIKRVFELGVRVIGENRIQETMKKLSGLPSDLRVDFIGHLQRNKAKFAVEHCQLIHSVDSLRLAREINKQAAQKGKTQDVLLEVNISGEKSKFGFQPDELRKGLEKIMEMKDIKIKGLMTVEPYNQNPETIRLVFRGLRKLRNKLEKKFKINLPELSMGMSDSYPIAVEEGATIVRLGRSLFD